MLQLQLRAPHADRVAAKEAEEDGADLREGEALPDAEARAEAECEEGTRLALRAVQEAVRIELPRVFRAPDRRISVDREHVGHDVGAHRDGEAADLRGRHAMPTNDLRRDGIASEGLVDDAVEIVHASEVVTGFLQLRRIVAVGIQTVDFCLRRKIEKLLKSLHVGLH